MLFARTARRVIDAGVVACPRRRGLDVNVEACWRCAHLQRVERAGEEPVALYCRLGRGNAAYLDPPDTRLAVATSVLRPL